MKRPAARRISIYIAAAIVLVGCVVNMMRAYDVAVWWSEHCGYEPDPVRYLRDTLKNFPGEWLVLDFDIWVIFPLALLYLLVQLTFGLIHRVSKKRHSDEAAAEKSERKIGKVLFILSFLPLAALLVMTVYSTIDEGCRFDLRSFGSTMSFYGLAFCIIPVLPTALVYQIVYLAKTFCKKGDGNA